jgi:hypothetical protein
MEYFLFGPGQGSTIGPILWLICFTQIYTSLSKESPSIVFTSIDKTVQVKSKGSAFVDDSDLGCTKQTQQYTQSSDIVKDLQVLAQEWERLLYSTGGALNIQKCFWFLLSWQWNNGQATCHTLTSLPYDLRTTSGGNTSTSEVIKRIETTEPYRTLGVWISPIGHNKGAMEILHQITTDFNKCITTSHLNRTEAIAAYIQHLLPKVQFQLPVLSLSQKECDKLTSVALAAFF